MKVRVAYNPSDPKSEGTVIDVSEPAAAVMIAEGTAQIPVASLPLGEMTKDELLDVAAERGIDVPHSAPKAAIIEELDKADA